jgi:hypothetical protein
MKKKGTPALLLLDLAYFCFAPAPATGIVTSSVTLPTKKSKIFVSIRISQPWWIGNILATRENHDVTETSQLDTSSN